MNSSLARPTNVIALDNTTLLRTSSILKFTGLTKTCKSRVLMSVIASCFTDNTDKLGFDITQCPDDKHVIYINTHMSEYESWELCKQTVDQIGYHPENLHFYDLILTRGAVARNAIEEILTAYPTYLLIIDGLADILTISNNPNVDKKLVDWLFSLTIENNCATIVSTYTNSDFVLNDFVDQKSFSTLTVERNKDEFTLSSDLSKTTIDFIWTPDGLRVKNK